MTLPLEPRRNIWVVDDSPTDAERVRRLLTVDYNVEVISDGALALERLASGSLPDLLLLDWVMPGMSGLEVACYMRSTAGELQRIPIILLTAEHGSQEIIQAFRSGANDYVSKPFVDEELKARVEALLGTKRLTERAERAESDLRTLLATAPDPIFAIDAGGRVTFANQEAIQALGKSEHEIVGHPFRELIPDFSVHNTVVSPGESYLPLPDVQLGAKVFSPSIRILPSDSAAQTTVALRDVTTRRQSDSRKLDFYSIIAHDLRTPVTAVLLRLQMAFRGKHGVIPASLLIDLQRSETSLRSLVGMINDFLEIARLEGVGYKIARDPVNLRALMTTTLGDLEPLFDKKEIRSVTNGLEQDCFVLGDAQRLSQVFSNLIGNAIKFTGEKGCVTTEVVPHPAFLEISVTDTGRGIDASEIPTLFDRFTRAREASRDTVGTGLGLMIVREIVQAHGGLIGVESQRGVGSRFWVRLPKAAEAPSTAATS